MPSVPGKRIAFLGGSFDPPHLGHEMLARRALEQDLTDWVLWVPAWAPPHKNKAGMSRYEDRLAMTELAAARLEDCEVSDFECRKKFEPSYSLRILDALTEEYPGSRLQLLIGQDSLEQLHTWFHAAELAERYEIIAFPRRAQDGKDCPLKLPEGFWSGRLEEKLRATLKPGSCVEIASSRLRMMAYPELAASQAVVPEVLEYIKEHKLYDAGSGK